MTLDEAKLSLDRYRDHGVPTGGFLEAVLANNLSDAIGFADETSLFNLREIVRHVYNHLPMLSWGSYDRVEDWLRAAHERKEVKP